MLKNEKLQQWALIAEIIGGVAIVVSLGIVAFELNQSTRQAELNTDALEMAAYQSLVDSVFRINASVANDPEMARLLVASQSNIEDLSREDSMRAGIFFNNLFRHGDLAFYQYQNGTIDESRLRAVLGPTRGYTRNSETARRSWQNLRISGLFQDAFIEYMDEFLDDET